ncbi:MAG: 23S rRNA (guanosine(2251)-2'-O)-methyltransferase RlmB [Treponema sp.]|nr:23S rRNA (guanosine(2251)-2'-O)-methyltransferase RlmB [Treponema sp.]
MEQVITGFHAIEERVLSAKSGDARTMRILYAKAGPRIKKILVAAKRTGVVCSQVDDKTLAFLTAHLSEMARNHRGIVLCVSGEQESTNNIVNFDEWLYALNNGAPEQHAATISRATVLILDSVTDVHNVGAILRSCDQFGVSLVVLPQARGASDIAHNEVIARTSAGAAAWVPVAIVPNLVRAVGLLKEAGFWIYGADAGGMQIDRVDFAEKTALVMGSEGRGMSQLLAKQCDVTVSIPTCGKIDSLNVSVAAGVLLYELHRRTL